MHNGKVGIILASDAYNNIIPDGCTQLFDIDSNVVQKTHELADNDTIAESSINAMYDAAASSLGRKRKGKACARPYVNFEFVQR